MATKTVYKKCWLCGGSKVHNEVECYNCNGKGRTKHQETLFPVIGGPKNGTMMNESGLGRSYVGYNCSERTTTRYGWRATPENRLLPSKIWVWRGLVSG